MIKVSNKFVDYCEAPTPRNVVDRGQHVFNGWLPDITNILTKAVLSSLHSDTPEYISTRLWHKLSGYYIYIYIHIYIYVCVCVHVEVNMKTPQCHKTMSHKQCLHRYINTKACVAPWHISMSHNRYRCGNGMKYWLQQDSTFSPIIISLSLVMCAKYWASRGACNMGAL